MTKHIADETLKLHDSLGETDKMGPNAEIVDKNTLAICNTHVKVGVNVNSEVKPELALTKTGKTRINNVKGRLGKTIQRLYDLEPINEPEKPLNIDLNLYQMENY